MVCMIALRSDELEWRTAGLCRTVRAISGREFDDHAAGDGLRNALDLGADAQRPIVRLAPYRAVADLEAVGPRRLFAEGFDRRGHAGHVDRPHVRARLDDDG